MLLLNNLRSRSPRSRSFTSTMHSGCFEVSLFCFLFFCLLFPSFSFFFYFLFFPPLTNRPRDAKSTAKRVIWNKNLRSRLSHAKYNPRCLRQFLQILWSNYHFVLEKNRKVNSEKIVRYLKTLKIHLGSTTLWKVRNLAIVTVLISLLWQIIKLYTEIWSIFARACSHINPLRLLRRLLHHY